MIIQNIFNFNYQNNIKQNKLSQPVNFCAGSLKPDAVAKIISNADVDSIKSSCRLLPEIEQTVEHYKSLIDTIYSFGRNRMFAIKRAFLGDISSKAKYLTFKNVGKKGESYTFGLMSSVHDKRVCRIVIHDKDDNLQNSFVFFKDGKVLRLKRPSCDTDTYRLGNFMPVKDSEINKYGLKNIFKILNKKFTEFSNFVDQRKIASSEMKIKAKEERLEAKLAQKQEAKLKKAELRRLKREEKVRLKEEQRQRIQQHRLQIKQEKLKQAEELKQQRLKQAEESKQEKLKRAEELKQQRLKQAEELKQEKLKRAEELKQQRLKQAEELKQEKARLKASNKVAPAKNKPKAEKAQKSVSVKHTSNSIYKEIVLNKVIDDFRKLFSTPVENRSPHLIHERLSNGKIFSGKFSLRASDGAEITVSRVKSSIFLDFTYFSMKVNNGGKGFILNLDPETCKILKSGVSGKPVVDEKNRVQYISVKGFLKEYPEAENLPKYLEEIFEYRPNVQRKVVKSTAQIRDELLKKKEEEVLKLLNSDDDFSL